MGGLFGFLCGSTTGPGMILILFMLGYGLSPANFVATFASIGVFTNLARVSSYAGLGLIDLELLMIGILAGLATIPGNLLGRYILVRTKIKTHHLWLDLLTFCGGSNFLWIAFF